MPSALSNYSSNFPEINHQKGELAWNDSLRQTSQNRKSPIANQFSPGLRAFEESLLQEISPVSKGNKNQIRNQNSKRHQTNKDEDLHKELKNMRCVRNSPSQSKKNSLHQQNFDDITDLL